MAWRPIELVCPSCDATVRADIDTIRTDGGSVEAEPPDRLRGQEVTCRRCAHEFELLFY